MRTSSDKMTSTALTGIVAVPTAVETDREATTVAMTEAMIVETDVPIVAIDQGDRSMNRLTLYILLFLLPALTACRRDVVSCAHQDVSEQGWAMTDTVRLSLNVPDTTQAYDLALMLRHTEQYTYQNLWFFIQSPDSLSPIQSDTVMACLADDRGRWFGSRVGRYYSGYVIARRSIVFPAAGTYTFTLVHGMRDSVIVGIADVGIELRKPSARSEEE